MILDWQIRNGGNGGGDNETEGTETQSYLILRQIFSWLSANVQPEEDRTNTNVHQEAAGPKYLCVVRVPQCKTRWGLQE